MQGRNDKFTNPLTPFDVAWFEVFPPTTKHYLEKEDEAVTVRLRLANGEDDDESAEPNALIDNSQSYQLIRASLRRRTRLLTFLGLPDLMDQPVSAAPGTLAGAIGLLVGVERENKESNVRFFSRLAVRAALTVLFIIPATVLGNTLALITEFPLALVSAVRLARQKSEPQAPVMPARIIRPLRETNIYTALGVSQSETRHSLPMPTAKELSSYRKKLNDYKVYRDRLEKQTGEAVKGQVVYENFKDRIQVLIHKLVDTRCPKRDFEELLGQFNIDVIQLEALSNLKFEAKVSKPRKENDDPLPVDRDDPRLRSRNNNTN